MRRHLQFTSLVTAIFLLGAPAGAETLQLADGSRWVAVASTQDKDEAIGIAGLYADSRSRVVKSTREGWYGVVFGPVKAKSIAAFRKSYQGWPDLPKDARLSTGEKYAETVWEPAPQPATADIADGKPGEIAAGGMTVTGKIGKDGDNTSVDVSAKDASGPLFDLSTEPDIYSDTGNTIAAVRLDPSSKHPQAVVTRFTGGAHCCTVTTIFTEKADRSWMPVEGETLDGGGYFYEDLDGDGAMELLSVDNSFLYAYSSYADSFAPLRIARLEGTKLADVTHDGRFAFRIRQDLARMEFLAKMNPELWKSRGFLAAWVATSIELGKGAEAWKLMLKNYERQSDFETQICATGQEVADCPEGKLKTVAFPDALAEHLKQQGYTPVPGM